MFKKKIIPFIFIFIILISLLCVPVSALSDLENFLSNFEVKYFSMQGQEFLNYSKSVSSSSINFSVQNNGGIEGYGNLDFVFTLGNTIATNTDLLNFSFKFDRGNGQLSFLNASNDYGGIYGYTSSQGYTRIGSVNIIGDTLTCTVNASTSKNYEHFRLGVYCYFNNYPYYYFNLYDCSMYYSNTIIDNQNQNTQSIINNQNVNTDKQIQADKDLYDKEHNEITNSGTSATDSVDAVPNKSDGFISALNGLIVALSYNGTECSWTFPAIKIPAIAGVMDEMFLSEEKPIDFSFWVEKMPSNILTLIRAITTIALVVYCFKELYLTISYVLTLKGGGE